MRRLTALGATTLLWLALAATTASADLFGPVQLASTSAVAGTVAQQAEEARFPVVSGNGRYVAFVGRYGGAPGLWRRDLQSGAIEQVAPGNSTMPSISSNGRYISFTTNEKLVPEDTNQGPDVYRRDMEPAPGEPQYTLVSAVNGSHAGASYTYTGSAAVSPEQKETEFGSLAGARSAMSADGNEVVFVTTAQSNLLGGGEPTPTSEVLVRNIATRETRLVSAEYEPGSGWSAERPVQPTVNEHGFTAYGAVFPSAEETPKFGTPAFSNPADGQAKWLGASISANGEVVSWMGQQLGRQAQLLAQEQAQELPQTAEPLWRQINAGPGAAIRRITGGSDPANPLCAASGEQSVPEHTPSPLDPCVGPFEHYIEFGEGLWGSKNGAANFVPQLSADGMTVAFITGAHELESGEQQFEEAESSDDLYVVNMASGLTRVQALRRLTEIGGGGNTQEKIEKSAKIIDFSLSADGTQVAFTTQRTQFPLGAPAFVSLLAAAPGMYELFDVDLSNDTLTRVTHGFESETQRSEELPTPEIPGTDPYHAEQGAYAPSFSADGNTLAFASSANNLVYGDGNGAPDAFVVDRLQPVLGVVQQYISSAPANPALAPPWKVGVTAVSLPDGSVRLYAEVPGAGTLGAQATAKVLAHHRLGGATRRSKRGSRRPREIATVRSRTVAAAHALVGAGGEGLATATLTLTSAYRSLASRGGGLSANVNVTFTAPGRPLVHASLHVTFLRTVLKPKASKGHSSARRHAGGGVGR
jgi:Tol biopolymer transport system component